MAVTMSRQTIEDAVLEVMREIVPEEDEVRMSVTPMMMMTRECDNPEHKHVDEPWVSMHFALHVPEANAWLTASWEISVFCALNDLDEFVGALTETWSNLTSRRLLLSMDHQLEKVLQEETGL